MKYLPWKDEVIVFFCAFLALLIWACSGCGTFTRAEAVQSGLDCIRLTLERALADCSGLSSGNTNLENQCKARVRAEHAAECEHYPDLCAETVVSGP